ncbi:MAG: glycine cleavage system protein GcvH [Clostridiales bacterium]|nr:glycine cleavage system protein GcvH [Clostridiales bacterium]
MNNPVNLKYTKSHEWVKELGDDVIEIGLTDHAQDALGDLVFVNLPEEGDEVAIAEAFGDVESVKAVSDIFSPATGVITQINEELLDDPAAINEKPYEAWLVRMKVNEREELLDNAAYEQLVDEEG